MWGIYFILAMILGILSSVGIVVGAVVGVILLILGAVVLAILSLVPLALILVLAILAVVAPFYFIFIIGDVIFTLVFVLTPAWLFTVASFLFWISPPGLVTATVWLILVFYVSYSYNGW